VPETAIRHSRHLGGAFPYYPFLHQPDLELRHLPAAYSCIAEMGIRKTWLEFVVPSLGFLRLSKE